MCDHLTQKCEGPPCQAARNRKIRSTPKTLSQQPTIFKKFLATASSRSASPLAGASARGLRDEAVGKRIHLPASDH
jgi:hypothetical protein